MSELRSAKVAADLPARTQQPEITDVARLSKSGADLARLLGMSVLRTMSLIAGAALLALGGSAIALLM